MAYNLSMQLNLQAPSAANINSVRKNIESGLKNIKVGVDSKNIAKTNNEIQSLGKEIDKADKKAKSFTDTLAIKGRGYAAYAIVSTAIVKLTNAISNATREALKFETELAKIAQVTGDTLGGIRSQSKALLDLSINYNITITKVAQLTRTLTQTGLSFREAAKGAEILARTSLLATFDSLSSTTEGFIAVLNSFNLTVQQSGQALESINAVSKRFAVESSDIIEAVKRTGGAFSAAQGNVNELIALFTAVRSTSRESAETIATGFRTIFGRLQRPKTIEFFKELGIELENAEGKFIGPLAAIEEISRGLERLGISAGDVRFAEVVEQIGGIRQISRVVPLLGQTAKAREALNIANNAGAESEKDIAKAQQTVAFQLGQLQKNFQALLADITGSDTFQVLAKSLITLANSFLNVTRALVPLLPLFTTLAAIKLGSNLSNIGKMFSGGGGMGKMMGFARGGIVPGSGNGDTVPAMLSPGEFVVRKSAVQAFGAANLGKINRYAEGDVVESKKKSGYGMIVPFEGNPEDAVGEYKKDGITYKTPVRISGFTQGKSSEFNKQRESVENALYKSGEILASGLNQKQLNNMESAKSKLGPAMGQLFENFVITASKLDNPGNDNFDIKRVPSILKEMTDQKASGLTDIKLSTDQRNIDDIARKAFNENGPSGFAKGGAVGTDTVPALLTPGEFVVNKKSAQAYGYANLKKINKYANGGVVDQVGFDVNMGRGTGDVVNTMDQFAKEMQNVLKDLGGVGLQIDKTYKLAEEANNKIRGAHSGGAGELRVNLGKGTTSTVAHETGHAVDKIAGGGGKQYASEQAGTLQNQLVEAIKPQLAAALKAKGVAEAELQYRLKNKEIFADLFQQSSPAIRNIIANTTDYEKGMAEIADLTKKQASAQRTVTAKTVKGDAMSGGQGALTEQIKKQSQVLQKLTAKQSAAEQKWQNVGTALSKLDGQIKQGITNRKAQQKAAVIRLKLSKQMAAAEKAYTDVTKQVTAVSAKRAENIAAARTMKAASTSGLQTGMRQGKTQTSEPPEGQPEEQGGAGINVGVGLAAATQAVFQFSTNITAAQQEILNGATQFAVQMSLLSENNLTAVGKKIEDFGASVSGYADKASGLAKKAGFGKKLSGAFGKGVGKLGGGIAKAGGALLKFAPVVGQVSTALTLIKTAGAALRAAFGTDFAKLKDTAIEVGNAQAAQKAAIQEYNNELLAGIPVIGDFVALAADAFGLEAPLDNIGRLAGSTAALRAAVVENTQAMKASSKQYDIAISEGQRTGDFSGVVEQINAQVKQTKELNEYRDNVRGELAALEQEDKEKAGFTGIFKGSSMEGDILRATGLVDDKTPMGDMLLSASDRVGKATGIGMVYSIAREVGFNRPARASQIKDTKAASKEADQKLQESFSLSSKSLLNYTQILTTQAIQQGASAAEALGKGFEQGVQGLDLQSVAEMYNRELGLEGEKQIAKEDVTNINKLSEKVNTALIDTEEKLQEAREENNTAAVAELLSQQDKIIEKQRLLEQQKVQAHLEEKRIKQLNIQNALTQEQLKTQDKLNQINAAGIAISQRVAAISEGVGNIKSGTSVIGTKVQAQRTGLSKLQDRSLSEALSVEGGADAFQGFANTLGLGKEAAQAISVQKGIDTSTPEGLKSFNKFVQDLDKQLMDPTLTGENKTAEITKLVKERFPAASETFIDSVASDIEKQKGKVNVKELLNGMNSQFNQQYGGVKDTIAKNGQVILDAENELAKLKEDISNQEFELRQKNADRLFKSESERIDLQEKTGIISTQEADVQRAVTRQGRVASIERDDRFKNLDARIVEARAATDQAQKTGDALPERQEEANLLKLRQEKTKLLIQAQEEEINSKKKLVEKELQLAQSIAGVKKNVIDVFTTGTDKEKRDLSRQLDLADEVKQRGTLVGLDPEDRKAALEMIRKTNDSRVAAEIQADTLIAEGEDPNRREEFIKIAMGDVSPTQALTDAVNAQIEAQNKRTALEDQMAQDEQRRIDLQKFSTLLFAQSVQAFSQTVMGKQDAGTAVGVQATNAVNQGADFLGKAITDFITGTDALAKPKIPDPIDKNGPNQAIDEAPNVNQRMQKVQVTGEQIMDVNLNGAALADLGKKGALQDLGQKMLQLAESIATVKDPGEISQLIKYTFSEQQQTAQ